MFFFYLQIIINLRVLVELGDCRWLIHLGLLHATVLLIFYLSSVFGWVALCAVLGSNRLTKQNNLVGSICNTRPCVFFIKAIDWTGANGLSVRWIDHFYGCFSNASKINSSNIFAVLSINQGILPRTRCSMWLIEIHVICIRFDGLICRVWSFRYWWHKLNWRSCG